MRPAALTTWLLMLTAAAPGGAARAEDGVQLARTSLEQAREGQGQVLERLTSLMEERRRSSSTVELMNTLTQLREMELVILQRVRGLMPLTFGKVLDKLTESERQRLDQLAADQRGVRQRLADWSAAVARYASAPDAAEAMRRMQTRISRSPARELMDQAEAGMKANRLAEGLTAGTKSADELARLLQSLEAMTTAPEQLLGKRIRELRDLLDGEKRVRVSLEESTSSGPDWALLRKAQEAVSEPARLLAFDESGLFPAALEQVRAAHEAMQSVDAALRKRQREPASSGADAAIAALERALALLESATETVIDPDLPQAPYLERRSGTPLPMQVVAQGGAPAPDLNAIAQLAADIAMLAKIRRAQAGFQAEALGRAPPLPEPADRQQALADRLPQLSRRVAWYLPSASERLDAAREGMNQAVELLRAADVRPAAEPQGRALDHLTAAEDEMRVFWEQLLAAMNEITSGASGVAPGGTSDEEPDKALLKRMMQLLPELVRLGLLVKDLDALILTTTPWAENEPDAGESAAVEAAVKRQRLLAETGVDIAAKTGEIGDEASSRVASTVREAVEFMVGAADALEARSYEKANGRQVDALEILRRAWLVAASSMASMSEIEQLSTDQQGAALGQAGMGAGEGGGGSEGVGGDSKPWYWNEPPRAREAISQSLAQPFPPGYDAAIKRYYERLSERKAER